MSEWEECSNCGAPLTDDEAQSDSGLCEGCEWERAEREAYETELDPAWERSIEEDR